jgi:hypothetical protein
MKPSEPNSLNVTKPAPTRADGNTSSRRAMVLTGEVEITIDWERLFKGLGQRAVRAKSGRSRYLGGAVVARVIKPGK